MIERALGSLTVLGAIGGLVSEGDRVRDRLGTLRPAAVGVAISADEMRGLRDYFVGGGAEPVVPLATTEAAEVRALARYGEVSVPNPSVLEAIRWSDSAPVPVEPLDPSDDRYASMFANSIGYFELVRRTLRERRLVKRAPEAANADEFVRTWSDTIEHGAGSRRLRLRRDEAVVEAATPLRARYHPLVVLVDRERFDGIVAGFDGSGTLVRTGDGRSGGASH
ncbi:MAG: hypothetical protein L3J86_05410 [Thermoplasmata archaeon]|nr:hypothetical protein [Thermoplasmata archaeon]